MLVGEEGLLPNLNRSDLQNFSIECKKLGKECLPKSEVISANMLLDATNVYDPNYDFISELAELDSQTFTNEENAIFGSSDSVTLSHILRTSATTLSDSGKWLNINLEESPLTIAARSALINDITKGEGKPVKDEKKAPPGKEKKESGELITGDLIWPYNADGSRMTDEEAMAYWGAAGYNELAIENAIAVREADRINGVDPPEQIDPDMVTTPPLKESKVKGPKGPQQQGIINPSGNYLPPIKQMKIGILPEEVLCNEGKELIFKSSDGSPKCVSMVAAEKLVGRGWATR